MPISEVVLITMGLLTVAMVAAGLFRNLPIPDTVMLVIIGIGLSELAKTWPPLQPLHEFTLTPDLVFFIFLPALIFESGFNLDARLLIKELAPVLVLAVPALLISTAIVGAGLYMLVDIDIVVALLFGALISATDPVAVVALFKELGAPARLNILVEGESLLNDATAIVVFTILLGMAVEGGDMGASEGVAAVIEFLRVFLGGALVGIAIGLLISELLHRLESNISAILTMSIVMAYASFILAEHELHVSGVMAAASSAVTLGVFGIPRIPQGAQPALLETWEVIALIANSLLFLLVGLSVDIHALANDFWLILAAVALVIAARAITVYPLVPLTTRLFSLPQVSMGERHIMWWGGLKGGLAIAIVLSIPPDLPGRSLLLNLTLGVVLFTLLVNAPTIRPLMSRLGLDRFTEEEEAELEQGLSHARGKADGILQRFGQTGLFSKVALHRFDQQINDILKSADRELQPDQIRRRLHLEALNTEFEQLNKLYDTGLISQYTLVDIRGILQRDREAVTCDADLARTSGPPKQSFFMRMETALLRRLREHNWAAGLLGRYQNARLAQKLQRDIAGVMMCDAVIAMLTAADEYDMSYRQPLIDIYEDRRQRRRARIETLRNEFDSFYQRFETHTCTRVALTAALRDAEAELHHGEIGAKAFNRIQTQINEALEAIPPLSEPTPAPQPKELITLIPLFQGLAEDAIAALASHAKPVTFLPGDVVMGQGEKGDALYIVMRGLLSVHHKPDNGDEHKVGELRGGDFFGEVALLGDSHRTATVRVETPATLLRLTRRDVLKLSDRHTEVKQRLKEMTESRRAEQD